MRRKVQNIYNCKVILLICSAIACLLTQKNIGLRSVLTSHRDNPSEWVLAHVLVVVCVLFFSTGKGLFGGQHVAVGQKPRNLG